MTRFNALTLGAGAAMLLTAGCSGRFADISGRKAGPILIDTSTARMTDVVFAKTAYTHLATGNPAAEAMIGWDNFQITDIDVGASYRKMPDATQRRDFRRAFLETYAPAFRKAAGVDGKTAAARVRNWRILRRHGQRTVVVGDVPAGVMRLTISGRGAGRRLTGLTTE